MYNKYDVVIIGSGLGGLLCGAILSKNGYKVVILEKNARIGGCLQSYSRDGALFETGVHYVGGLDEGQTLNEIFSYIGLLSKLKIRRLDQDGFDIIKIGNSGKEYAFAQTYNRFIETLTSAFPSERKGIETYCEKIQDVCKRFPLYNLRNGDFMDKFGVLELNARDTINSFVSDPLLQNVLAGNNSIYAGTGSQTPFYLHALIQNHYIESAWRCDGGGSQIATILGNIIASAGGDIFTRAEVSRILVQDHSVTKILTKDDREFIGERVISDLHPANTIKLTQTAGFRQSYINRVTNLENTVSVFVLNIVFKESALFPFLNHNIYYHSKMEDIWNGPNYQSEHWPESYAFFITSSKDGYAHSASIMCYMKYSEFEPWSESYNTVFRPGNRGIGYDEFKEEKVTRLFTLLEQTYPGFRSLVKSYHTVTPLTYRDYTGTPFGSLYGLMRDYRDPFRSIVSVRTKISNLLFTGQNLSMHGVLGVSVTALATCGELLGMDYLLNEIHNT